MPTPPKDGKLLYHMTRLENMPSILAHGLLSRKRAEERGLLAMDIADPEILAGRENVRSPRQLSEYVPFHFFVKNPFDGRVCRRYGSENMVIIAITREWAKSLKSSYILTAHPLHPAAQCLPYNEGMDAIDWRALESRDYHNNDTKQKCMAECLIPDRVAPYDFSYIYVYNDEAKRKIDVCPSLGEHGCRLGSQPPYCFIMLLPKGAPLIKYSCTEYWTSPLYGYKIQVAPYMFP